MKSGGDIRGSTRAMSRLVVDSISPRFRGVFGIVHTSASFVCSLTSPINALAKLTGELLDMAGGVALSMAEEMREAEVSSFF